MSHSHERLALLTRASAEDALFAMLAKGPRALGGVSRRRAAAHDAIARGEPTPTMQEFEPWLCALSWALAPVGAPWFVPMREAIDDGLTLEREAKGLRAMLLGVSATERLRRVGLFAVRVVRVVSVADGQISADEQRAIDVLVSAMGLPEADVRMLAAEPMPAIVSLELPEELEWNLARAIVVGAWEVAATDGVEEAERAAILEVAARLHVQADVIEEARHYAEESTAKQHLVGLAAVDALRYVLQPLDDAQTLPLFTAAAHLSVPPLKRGEVLRVLESKTATPLAAQHQLDKEARAAVLGAAWAAALATDPTLTMRARLAARHDRVAVDLGSDHAGRDARDTLDEYMAEILARGVGVAGG